jgi:hypothetical protein
MRDIGAAGAATIVRLRRLLACGGRPHTFTVRFRMHQKPVFLLATLVTLGSNPLLAPTSPRLE